MALAGWNASVPVDGRRSLGNPHRHGFIKKTRATPDEDLTPARQHQRE
jgi:hypothetical protein